MNRIESIVKLQENNYVNLSNSKSLTTDADFAFENSEVEATVDSHIISVKNPVNGFIKAKSIGEIILDTKREPKTECDITII